MVLCLKLKYKLNLFGGMETPLTDGLTVNRLLVTFIITLYIHIDRYLQCS